jgi:predicted N-acetyltransferase YhbS
MSAAPATASRAEPKLRPIESGDAAECARIIFEAFGGIHDYHHFQRDFPTVEAASALLGMFIPHAQIWGVVAEIDGRIVGSNFLDERSPIRGLGPITVAPEGQGSGVGRKLMQAALERGQEAPGIRLLQDAFNMGSLALYESLGFDVKEPVALVSGSPRNAPDAAVAVRPLEEGDLDECERLCQAVHGYERTHELKDALQAFAPFVAVRDGRITAYATSVTFWPMNHGVAETKGDMKALLQGAGEAVDQAPGFLVPLRSGLFRWCLEEGLRVVKPMNLMACGDYQEPRGAWFPSVLY